MQKKKEQVFEIKGKSDTFKLKEFLMLDRRHLVRGEDSFEDSKLFQHAFYAEIMRNTSRCDYTTDNIISYLHATPPHKMAKFKNLDYQENLPLLEEFFDQNDDKLNHSFFLFQNRLPSHSYIIQKKWNGEKFLYRIHQSWRDEFTLGQWEGLDKWPDTEFTKQNIFKDEYRGKDLDMLQVKQFLKEMVEISISKEKQSISGEAFDNTCEVTRFNADVDMLQVYEKLTDQFNIKKKNTDIKPKGVQEQAEKKSISQALESPKTSDLLRSPAHSGSSLFPTKEKKQMELTQILQKDEDRNKEKTTTYDSNCIIL